MPVSRQYLLSMQDALKKGMRHEISTVWLPKQDLHVDSRQHANVTGPHRGGGREREDGSSPGRSSIQSQVDSPKLYTYEQL